jgi:hypothetical protein
MMRGVERRDLKLMYSRRARYSPSRCLHAGADGGGGAPNSSVERFIISLGTAGWKWLTGEICCPDFDS